ncbi:aminotransferase class I/II-fold pyridoxal phosphate-dependent enzyme [Rhodohalobacter sp. SW132]|uniref:DegT/DnrJ/EryC1/StrS family aminotransferase n=1 Tax=Rhodohalobacter sp. SW132 TaxID=2293433 RepID=UPI000E263BCC|nr:aminotransferase class I/II-fold pyridoxal phosphate-dependent enzyme [Rhodohalobacter sp. SW132]REL24749.1 aminotransferase class I/II-fold pyridoxal phosphate-dependent enzyme [Rhodohalobacter sp. SW132]
MPDQQKRIYLSSPHMGGGELDYIHDAFEKNWIAPLGANVNGFEEDLAGYSGRDQAAVVTSGTAGIHLALILCGVQPGDEVFCQSFTFTATANPIRYQGAEPVFIDSEPETWNMDPDLLEEAITDRLDKTSSRHQKESDNADEIDKNKSKSSLTGKSKSENNRPGMPKAIIVVHLYGMPAKMERILEIGRTYNIPVIEDAAEALGSSINGKKCGSFGKLSVYSFNGNKIITTSGGGALLGDDEELISRSRFLATQARDDAPHYQHSQLGYNYRMSNITAGIGRGQMQVLDQHVELRRSNHNFYFEALNGEWADTDFKDLRERFGSSSSSSSNQTGMKKSGIYFLKEPEGYFSNRWLTTVLINPNETGGITREDIRLSLEKENIECRPLWKPMHRQPLYNNSSFYSKGGDETSVSEFLFKYGLCLPSGSNMADSDRQRIIHAMNRALRK